MKRLKLIIAALLCLGSTAFAQNAGNCTYSPTLDTKLHTPRKLSITFDDYQSIKLTDAETALIYVYRTSLEKQHGNNSDKAMEYYTYSDGMVISGNTLTFYPQEYHASGTTFSMQPNEKFKAWGTDTQDYLRVAFSAGMLTAIDKDNKSVLLDSISYKYVYTEENNDEVLDPFECTLTPADGEEVTTLGSVKLSFPNCPGVFTLNYDQTQNPYVLDEQGNLVTTATRMFDYEARFTAILAFKANITKAGTYTLVIPEASYHMSTSVEAWEDSIKHPEIRATYKVLGDEEKHWTAIPADGSTVKEFDGIHVTFDKTIVSKQPNVNGGTLKVYEKDNDRYAAMEFQLYFAKNDEHTINFTTASQISKIKDQTTYYYDLPYGLLAFDDGTVNDGLHIEFTYDKNFINYVVGDNYVGYTTAAVTRTNGVRFNSGEKQGMAIYLPKEKTTNLAGCTIKAIRTATGTTQMDSPRLIIIEGDDINQTPVVEQSTSKFSTSLKDYALNTPYTITGDKALYVGILCSLSAAYKPMLFDGTLDLPSGSAWAITDNGWEDISNRGYGAPNIQILLDKNLGDPDVLVKPFHTSTYNKMGDDMTINTQVFNYGLQEVNSFDITYKIGDDEAVTKHISDVTLPQGGTYDINIDDATIASWGKLPLMIEISNINGTADAAPSDNKQTSSSYIYPANMKKKILYEEFTGQGCVNCPSGTATVNSVLANYEGQFVEVYHHAGYNPDNFSLAEDHEYTWFYNNGGNTYAPGGMANRRPASPSQTSVVVQSNVRGDVMAIVQSAMQVAPCVGVSILNDYDKDSRMGQVTVNVTCYEMPSNQEHRLNVWLIQDNIERYQSGSGMIKHNNAMRMSLTDVWGKPIQLTEGKTTSMTFDYTIPATIEGAYATHVVKNDETAIEAIPEDMRIVAFVADFSNDALNCPVWNAEECAVTEPWSTAIDSIRQQQTDNTYYDLQGRVIKTPRRGLYITNGKTIIKR